ncbi:hypothetical protein CEXT_147101 [Caerostris extrusa]|uniref:Peptidase S1 domain-containing protein n=1 Tax=Caerostris extrusa TaxID=172846 RepID=A0AAV4XYW4_CAEEX|nr:hypothetical protein CEXT_147101 [Caerostris extrusa]
MSGAKQPKAVLHFCCLSMKGSESDCDQEADDFHLAKDSPVEIPHEFGVREEKSHQRCNKQSDRNHARKRGKHPLRENAGYHVNNQTRNSNGKEKADDDCQKCGKLLHREILSPKSIQRVLNGIPVSPTFKYPWIVSIIADGGVLCGGTIISSRHVLTAAHCFRVDAIECKDTTTPPDHCYIKADRIKVGLLGEDPMAFRQTIPANTVLSHKEFDNDKLIHDVALVQLAEGIRCDLYSSPSASPERSAKHGAGDGGDRMGGSLTTERRPNEANQSGNVQNNNGVSSQPGRRLVHDRNGKKTVGLQGLCIPSVRYFPVTGGFRDCAVQRARKPRLRNGGDVLSLEKRLRAFHASDLHQGLQVPGLDQGERRGRSPIA